MRHWVIFSILAGLFIVSLTLLLLFFRDAKSNSVGFEIAKALLQVGFVSVIGAIISVLVYEYQRKSQKIDQENEQKRQQFEKQRELDRKRLEYREQLLLSILSRAMSAYSQAKKARRLLRGRGIANAAQASVVLADQYDLCFELLNEAQLDLENLARDVKTSKKAFSQPDVIVTHLGTMESYLGKLIGEYEEKRKRFSGDKPSLPLRELPLLEDYIDKAVASNFKPQVIEPYSEVQCIIRGDLLYPNLPDNRY